MPTRRANQWAAVAVAALFGLTGLGCGDSPVPGDGGEASIALVLPGGITLSGVTYTVFSSSNGVIASGAIDTRDPNATVSVDVALSPATGDTVTLSATTGAGLQCQGTSAPFDIVSGKVTPVQVTLVCGGSSAPTGRGQVEIIATLADVRCPTISSGVAAPAETSLGGTIQVSITAAAQSPTDALTYAWTPAAGFDRPSASQAVFTCMAPGLQTLTLVVTDASGTTPCSTTTTFPVDCVPPTP